MKAPNLLRKKELFVAESHIEATEWEGYDPERHDIWQDEVTRLWGVYYKLVDRTVRAPVIRHSRSEYKHYRRPIVIAMIPGDVLSMRLKGRRAKGAVYSETFEDIFAWMAQRAALRAMSKKRVDKAARKSLKKAKRFSPTNTSRSNGGSAS